MSPFKALYGWPCRTPLNWSEVGERVIFGPDIVIEAEDKVRKIRANILTVQSCQKSYTNKRRRSLEFEVRDHVYLRVSPMKGVRRFIIKDKLAPCYISPYPIIDKYGPTSYQVELPWKLSGVHNVFHISQLKWCLKPLTPFRWNPTWPTKPILSRFSTNKTESHTIRLLGSTRSNEMITSKTKPRGNMKTSYDPTTPSSFNRGNHPTPACLYALAAISGRDFF
jgi:hypothetical protein